MLRTSIVIALVIVTIRATTPLSAGGPFDGKKFKGRIAYSADGNHNDADDWAASPTALAIFARLAFGTDWFTSITTKHPATDQCRVGTNPHRDYLQLNRRPGG